MVSQVAEPHNSCDMLFDAPVQTSSAVREPGTSLTIHDRLSGCSQSGEALALPSKPNDSSKKNNDLTIVCFHHPTIIESIVQNT
jgi:hypothetical protein